MHINLLVLSDYRHRLAVIYISVSPSHQTTESVLKTQDFPMYLIHAKNYTQFETQSEMVTFIKLFKYYISRLPDKFFLICFFLNTGGKCFQKLVIDFWSVNITIKYGKLLDPKDFFLVLDKNQC